MKIILNLLVILIISLPLYAEISGTIDYENTTEIGDQTITPSQNVKIKFVSDSTKYTAESWHINGTYKYATTQDDDIKKAECNSGDPCGDDYEGDSLTAGDMPF